MKWLGATTKDAITNVIAFVVVISGAINAYIQSLGGGEINWLQLGTAVVVAVISYVTGKGSDARPKKAA